MIKNYKAIFFLLVSGVFLVGYTSVYAISSIVSVSSATSEANASSCCASVSSDGQYVVFQSNASNLVGGDTNGFADIFVFDVENNLIERVSLATDGTEGNDSSSNATLSLDGRYVAFDSTATNLVPGDTNGFSDVFVYDRQTDTIERVSVTHNGDPVDGDSYVFGNALSSDGRYVTFYSYAENMVVGDSNFSGDVFVYDRQTDTIERVSVATGGAQGNAGGVNPTITPDGRYVVFLSDSSDLVAGDTNFQRDVFVYDRQTDTIERVSLSSGGTEGNGGSNGAAISSDGRYVAFYSASTNLVVGDTNARDDAFVYDRQTDTIERVSIDDNGIEGDGNTFETSLSSDGRYVAFYSASTNLVADDTNGVRDYFVYDRNENTIERITVALDNTESDQNAEGYYGALSGEGNHVVFHSAATTLVLNDTNGVSDVFLVNLGHVIPDTEEPVISSITVNESDDSAVITWNTDENASSLVEYGATASYGQNESGGGNTTSHVVTLTDLSKCETYHYRVVSTDAAANTAQSDDQTFSTHCPRVVSGYMIPQKTSNASLPMFTTFLSIGMYHPQVLLLQQYLNKHGATVATSGPGSLGKETNFFGPKTKAALIVFQNLHKEEILLPIGLTRGTGFLGSMTQKYMNLHP